MPTNNANAKLLGYLLKTFGRKNIRLSSAKKSFMIYNPVPFDMNEVQNLSNAVGLTAIHKAEPSFYEGKQKPPHLCITSVKDYTEDELSDYLDGFTE